MESNVIPQISQLPNWIFWFLGILVFINLASAATALGAAMKVIWHISRFHLQLEINIKDTHNAHHKIRETNTVVAKIEKKLIQAGILKA